jgi:hypothetical protein
VILLIIKYIFYAMNKSQIDEYAFVQVTMVTHVFLVI